MFRITSLQGWMGNYFQRNKKLLLYVRAEQSVLKGE